MLISIRRVLLFLIFVSSISPTPALAAPESISSCGLDLDAARRNAFRIFNTVHSAMRQFGSSSNHNGLSFFLATVPEGNLFYHGRHSPNRPDSFEWLAFEVEHAYGFAQPRMQPPDNGDGDRRGQQLPTDKSGILSRHPSNPEIGETQISQTHTSHFIQLSKEQHRLSKTAEGGVGSGDDEDEDDDGENSRPLQFSRGYFQTYRAERPLKLIYIDGMGAAKGSWGTSDSQDLLLEGFERNFSEDHKWGDAVYGKLLCKLARQWGIDGWIRMECGFEIIYCNFATGAGLELVSQHGTAFPNETYYQPWEDSALMFELLRTAAQRYHGMSSGRIQVDWSSMVTAFAYDVNITNPDPVRQDLPRLIEVTKKEREAIRARLGQVVAGRQLTAKPTVNWQSVVDDIVSRFSDRIHFIAHGNFSKEVLWGEVSTLIHPFLDYPAATNASTPSPASITLCTRHYLDAAMMRRKFWTPEDAAIFVAVEVVAAKICSSLFQIRSLLSSNQSCADGEESALIRSREVAAALMKQLRWTTWKECGPCASSGQFCFIPMFPAGSVEDYYFPRCKGLDDMEESFKGRYWSLGYSGPNLDRYAASGK